jgi:hypothetical protein
MLSTHGRAFVSQNQPLLGRWSTLSNLERLFGFTAAPWESSELQTAQKIQQILLL